VKYFFPLTFQNKHSFLEPPRGLFFPRSALREIDQNPRSPDLS
jgi:hypothetical protein